jgi:uncharacterized protein
MERRLEEKLDGLRERIRKMDSALVAYSGGVDSTVLLRICRDELGERAVAVTALSENYPSSELALARRVAGVIGARHITYRPARHISSRGMVYHDLKALAARMKLKNVLVGTHLDDAAEFGFNFVAARKTGVSSPMLESGLSKAEVRLLAKEFGLPNWDKIASAKKCPTTKVPLIKRLACARRYLVSLGFSACSLVVSGGNICISGPKSDFVRLSRSMAAIQKKMRSLGFCEVLIRLAS